MTAPSSSLPALRLKPKANARAIRHGAPWVYDNELVLDRRSKAIAAGSVALLLDDERNELGLVAVNTASRIVGRMLDRDTSAVIDQAWFATRLRRALDMRERLYDAPFYRLVHAEADGLPGVVIDRFGDIAVVQPNAAWADVRIDMLCAALCEVTGVTTVIKNATGRARSLEGLDEDSAVLCGAMPSAPVPVPMNGATYMADLEGGQKTGLFFDQRPNHCARARGCWMCFPMLVAFRWPHWRRGPAMPWPWTGLNLRCLWPRKVLNPRAFPTVSRSARAMHSTC